MGLRKTPAQPDGKKRANSGRSPQQAAGRGRQAAQRPKAGRQQPMPARGPQGGPFRGQPQPPVRRPRVLTPSNLLLALIGFLFLATLSVVLVLNLRTIYYFDIRYQQLEEKTGFSEEVIRENYDTLIDYNLITKRVKELEFPSFPMSEQGRIHFAEVKRIFTVVQYLCFVTGALLLMGLVKKMRRRDYGSLKLTAIFTFFIPIVLGVLAVTSWDTFFIRFHQIFFRNNYWIFDPVTDPVIRILPDVFFFHCAAAILLFLLLGGVVSGALYRFATRRYRARPGRDGQFYKK